MSMTEDLDPIDKFECLTSPFSKSWNSIRLEVVGAIDDNQHILLGLRGFLVKEPHQGSEVHFEAPSLLVLTEWKTCEELGNLLKELGEGRIEVAGRTFRLEGYEHFDTNHSTGHGRGPFGLDFPYIWLRSYGKSVRELTNETDINRMLVEQGYEGLYDLTDELFGFKLGGANLTRIEIVGSIAAVLRCEEKDGEVELTVSWDAALSPDDFKLVYSIRSKDETVKRKRISIEEGIDGYFFDEIQGVNWFHLREGLGPGMSLRAHLFHSTFDNPLDAIWFFTEEARAVLDPLYKATEICLSHTYISEETRVPQELGKLLQLKGTTKHKDRYEKGVVDLLALTRFRCIDLGKGVGAEGVDLLALSPDSKKLVVVSCTISNDVANKVRSLIRVRSDFVKELEDIEVMFCVFTALPLEKLLKEDVQAAENASIHVISREDTNDLVGLLENSAEEEMWSRFMERILYATEYHKLSRLSENES